MRPTPDSRQSAGYRLQLVNPPGWFGNLQVRRCHRSAEFALHQPPMGRCNQRAQPCRVRGQATAEDAGLPPLTPDHPERVFHQRPDIGLELPGLLDPSIHRIAAVQRLAKARTHGEAPTQVDPSTGLLAGAWVTREGGDDPVTVMRQAVGRHQVLDRINRDLDGVDLTFSILSIIRRRVHFAVDRQPVQRRYFVLVASVHPHSFKHHTLPIPPVSHDLATSLISPD